MEPTIKKINKSGNNNNNRKRKEPCSSSASFRSSIVLVQPSKPRKKLVRVFRLFSGVDKKTLSIKKKRIKNNAEERKVLYYKINQENGMIECPINHDQNIINFYGVRSEYGLFSNFTLSKFNLGGKEWPSVEHYFQGQKFQGTPKEEKIRTCGSPSTAKKLGGKRDPKYPFNAEEWDYVREKVMLEGLWAKFTQNETLKKKLLSTRNSQLIETSLSDHYWGNAIKNGKEGMNRLGNLLMLIREFIRELEDSEKLNNITTEGRIHNVQLCEWINNENDYHNNNDDDDDVIDDIVEDIEEYEVTELYCKSEKRNAKIEEIEDDDDDDNKNEEKKKEKGKEKEDDNNHKGKSKETTVFSFKIYQPDAGPVDLNVENISNSIYKEISEFGEYDDSTVSIKNGNELQVSLTNDRSGFSENAVLIPDEELIKKSIHALEQIEVEMDSSALKEFSMKPMIILPEDNPMRDYYGYKETIPGEKEIRRNAFSVVEGRPNVYTFGNYEGRGFDGCGVVDLFSLPEVKNLKEMHQLSWIFGKYDYVFNPSYDPSILHNLRYALKEGIIERKVHHAIESSSSSSSSSIINNTIQGFQMASTSRESAKRKLTCLYYQLVEHTYLRGFESKGLTDENILLYRGDPNAKVVFLFKSPTWKDIESAESGSNCFLKKSSRSNGLESLQTTLENAVRDRINVFYENNNNNNNNNNREEGGRIGKPSSNDIYQAMKYILPLLTGDCDDAGYNSGVAVLYVIPVFDPEKWGQKKYDKDSKSVGLGGYQPRSSSQEFPTNVLNTFMMYSQIALEIISPIVVVSTSKFTTQCLMANMQSKLLSGMTNCVGESKWFRTKYVLFSKNSGSGSSSSSSLKRKNASSSSSSSSNEEMSIQYIDPDSGVVINKRTESWCVRSVHPFLIKQASGRDNSLSSSSSSSRYYRDPRLTAIDSMKMVADKLFEVLKVGSFITGKSETLTKFFIQSKKIETIPIDPTKRAKKRDESNNLNLPENCLHIGDSFICRNLKTVHLVCMTTVTSSCCNPVYSVIRTYEKDAPTKSGLQEKRAILEKEIYPVSEESKKLIMLNHHPPSFMMPSIIMNSKEEEEEDSTFPTFIVSSQEYRIRIKEIVKQTCIVFGITFLHDLRQRVKAYLRCDPKSLSSFTYSGKDMLTTEPVGTERERMLPRTKLYKQTQPIIDTPEDYKRAIDALLYSVENHIENRLNELEEKKKKEISEKRLPYKQKLKVIKNCSKNDTDNGLKQKSILDMFSSKGKEKITVEEEEEQEEKEKEKEKEKEEEEDDEITKTQNLLMQDLNYISFKLKDNATRKKDSDEYSWWKHMFIPRVLVDECISIGGHIGDRGTMDMGIFFASVLETIERVLFREIHDIVLQEDTENITNLMRKTTRMEWKRERSVGQIIKKVTDTYFPHVKWFLYSKCNEMDSKLEWTGELQKIAKMIKQEMERFY
jgi:N-glycosidase YbiA